MEAVAKLNSIPMSARKMRLVADLVRGKAVGEALSILKYSKQEASYWIEKNLVSAIANWENKIDNMESADDFDLVISEIFVDQGAQLKRFRPAPQGRAHRIRKHSCHVTIKVNNLKQLPEPAAVEEDVETIEE
ncbi:MAG: 50S ribosomal protein L22 [Bacteroidota bacterium]